MTNHVACERREGGEHWRVLSTFAESVESEVFTRMPNQDLRHQTALCESGINFRHGHGEEAAFAELFCGMRYAKVESTFVTAMGRRLHLQNFSAGCSGPMCSMP